MGTWWREREYWLFARQRPAARESDAMHSPRPQKKTRGADIVTGDVEDDGDK